MFGIPEAFVGHAAGLATSCLWTGTSLAFTAASRRIGPTAVNAARIALAIALHGITYRVWAGHWVPAALPGQVLLLALSGVVGLVVGDQALFSAFVQIGPRLAQLIMTTAPLFAAIFGWLALGEKLDALAWLGIALTVGGVAWVVAERPKNPTNAAGHHRARGLFLAFVAAGCQAGGLLLSKQGIGHGWLPARQQLNPQVATLLRVFFAGLAMLPIVSVYGLRERQRRAAGIFRERIGSRRAGVAFAFCGSLVGPYLGVWMSLVAADRAPLGVAQTLCSLPPILILPFTRLVYQEHVSVRAVIGALVAVGGVAVLFVPRG
jgi:drug/metabolite transporter (DMT)-like permease